MGKILIAIVALVIGLIVGGIGGAALGIGGGAGVGIATGLSAGACGIVQAAQEEGLLTDEQVDQVFARALADFSEMAGEAAAGDGMLAGGAAECNAVMARLREAAAE
jgi:hypothetical protein